MRRWLRLGYLCAEEQSGTIVVLFALLLVPIAGLMAGAIDFARQLETKQELQDALDSGALAAAKYAQANATSDPAKMAAVEEKAKAIGAQMFRANFSSAVGMPAPEPVFAFMGDRVAGSAELQFDAAFLGIVGITQLGAAGYSEAIVPSQTDAEIVMVLDYSGSMRDNDKYKRMAEAAKGFITRTKEENLAKTLLGLVPFSDFVRLDLKGRYIRDVEQSYFDQTMSVCISNRGYPFSTTDETPTAAMQDSKWRGIGVPEGTLAFPGRLSSGLDETLYGNKSLADMLPGCEAMANRRLFIRDLTDDYQMMLDAIDEMQTHEYTNIALGAEIGWHLLPRTSPTPAVRPPPATMSRRS